MTNFAACRSKRSFAKQNAIRETQSRATTNRVAVGSSVISCRLPFQPTANGNQTSEWNCRASIYSGHSSSALSRASTYQASTVLSTKSFCCQKYTDENCNQTDRNHQVNAHSSEHCEQANSGHCGHSGQSNGNRTDQTSVVSLNYLIKSQKCGLCKDQIKFFKETFICGHVFHGECLWRYEKLNPTYDSNQCPRNCLRRLMMSKRTRSIESRISNCSSNSSRSSTSSSSS